ILAFAASLRTKSLNARLVALACKLAEREGAVIDLARFSEFEMPLYNGDEDAAHGMPPGAVALKDRIEKAAALMISVPEYNYSIPGTLKNAIDWVSRSRPMPWRSSKNRRCSRVPEGSRPLPMMSREESSECRTG